MQASEHIPRVLRTHELGAREDRARAGRNM